MGTADEDRTVPGRPTHRRRSSRVGATVGLLVSLGVLAAVTAAVAVGLPNDVSTVGTRPDFSASQASQGPATGGPTGSPSPSQSRQPGQSGPVLTVPVRPALPTGPRSVVEPVRFQAPSVGIDARVDPTGVNADASVVIPKDAYRVGWYRFGPAPGSAKGSAVIVGHVDSRTQGRGALFPLRGVRVGDRLTVTLEGGATLEYRVVSRESISKRQLPAAELFARGGQPRLTVITCGGAYLKRLGGYQDNVVVTAVPLRQGAAA